jgi:hypothetical protein
MGDLEKTVRIASEPTLRPATTSCVDAGLTQGAKRAAWDSTHTLGACGRVRVVSAVGEAVPSPLLQLDYLHPVRAS